MSETILPEVRLTQTGRYPRNRMSRVLANRSSRFIYYGIIPVAMLLARAIYKLVRDLPEESRTQDCDCNMPSNDHNANQNLVAELQKEHQANIEALHASYSTKIERLDNVVRYQAEQLDTLVGEDIDAKRPRDADMLRTLGLQVHVEVMAKVQAEHRASTAELTEQIESLVNERDEAVASTKAAEHELRRVMENDSVLGKGDL